ncbi:MAG: serine hydrolase domain-containing protein, partial [Chitinophagales bacterium]
SGMEFAVGGMNVTLRDYAKLGLLYLNKGKWNGKQIVPEAWVKKSINPRASHLMPGRNNPNSSNDFGYGYQWWIPIEPMGGDYFAAGIYNQYIYVNPEKDLVIVKTAANPHFTEDYDHSKENYIDLFQNIAKQF